MKKNVIYKNLRCNTVIIITDIINTFIIVIITITVIHYSYVTLILLLLLLLPINFLLSNEN